MKITKTDNYLLIKPNADSIAEFVEKLIKEEKLINENNLILDISEKFNTDFLNLSVFLPLNKQHKQNGTSFVIIFNNAFEEDLLDELDIVPTLTEAIDIIEMDNISRDLGF
jgi:hypothetical protein